MNDSVGKLVSQAQMEMTLTLKVSSDLAFPNRVMNRRLLRGEGIDPRGTRVVQKRGGRYLISGSAAGSNMEVLLILSGGKQLSKRQHLAGRKSVRIVKYFCPICIQCTSPLYRFNRYYTV